MTLNAPLIGNWYQDVTESQVFEVVAIDEKNSTIEIQYADGEIGEFDMDAWQQMHIVVAAPPEDSNAGYDFSDEEYLLDEDSSVWNTNNPLEYLEPDSFQGFDDY